MKTYQIKPKRTVFGRDSSKPFRKTVKKTILKHARTVTERREFEREIQSGCGGETEERTNVGSANFLLRGLFFSFLFFFRPISYTSVSPSTIERFVLVYVCRWAKRTLGGVLCARTARAGAFRGERY